MLFVGVFWLLMTCVADLQILAHLWGAVWSVVCSMWTLNCVARNFFYGCLLPTLPLPSSALHILPHQDGASLATFKCSLNPWERQGSLPFQIQAASDVLFLSPVSISIFYILQREADTRLYIHKYP